MSALRALSSLSIAASLWFALPARDAYA